MTLHRCIWCLVEKPENSFNVEHVLPQSFGTFEQNFTLVNTVCKDCNDFFSRELEPWLARDSLEGFDRYRYGHKSTTEFKSQGKRSTTRVQITQGLFVGAWGYTLPSEGHLGVRPFPQVGFATSADGPYEWYMLEDLPTPADLKAKGFTGQCHLRFCECGDMSEAKKLLEAKGFSPTLTETFAPQKGGGWVEQVFRPTIHHRRGLAKIAMNYLAHQCGSKFAFETRFNAIRDLVMRATEPSYEYYAIDELPIVEGDKQGGKRLFGHMLLVQQRKDGVEVEGIVSLYNRFRHGIRLAVEPGTAITPSGHFFDVTSRVIHDMRPT
jgi:HNH endonuclease